MSATPGHRVPDLGRARVAGRELGGEIDMAGQLRPYERQRWRPGDTPRPTLQLDDVSGIPFLVDVAGVQEYQHRGRLRAADHDVYVTVTPEAGGYEPYCRDTLHMGAPEHLVADPIGPPIAVARACTAGDTHTRLVEVARDAGGMTVHPYMGIEDVWELAAMLSVDSRTPVRVISPPPPVTWIANDKALFDELVARVLGREALVETRISRDAAAIETDLRMMSQRHNRVGLKRTRCASAMGNAVFASCDVHAEVDAADAVQEFLRRTEWPVGEEVLTVAWLDTDLSPSTQLWIPPLDSGEPRLDGIYEQILKGEEKVFVGSRPSTLPDAVNQELATGALLVAAALQELGYVGRCSFDHLVTGDPKGEFDVVFTECNGRWGGTSTPMSLLDRLLHGPRPAYRAQDLVFPELIGASLTDLLELAGELVFHAESGQGRFIFYNIGPLHGHGKFDVISIGEDQDDAERGVLEILPTRLGL
ncbi:MAG: hypothetical protein JRF42_08330 [Deltaproteobacteria bacterium]|nr:hypothetical protein [Deltaproteobacteria bacterium]